MNKLHRKATRSINHRVSDEADIIPFRVGSVVHASALEKGRYDVAGFLENPARMLVQEIQISEFFKNSEIFYLKPAISIDHRISDETKTAQFRRCSRKA